MLSQSRVYQTLSKSHGPQIHLWQKEMNVVTEEKFQDV
jgi:hypothetical protein